MQANQRLNHLDAVRAFALLLGIVFHASLSFSPVYIGWAVMDISTHPLILAFMAVSHSFRMPLFFLIAGFFSHMTFHGKGGNVFLKSRLVRIVIPFLLGWFILRPLIVSGWIMGGASLSGDVDIIAGLKGGFQSLSGLPSGIFTGSHLWFLYYLTLVTATVLLLRLILSLSLGSSIYRQLRTMCDKTVSWISSSQLGVFALALPTAFLIWNMKEWGMDTPDKSLIPHWPALATYGGLFSFGWILHRNGDLISQFSRVSISKVAIAIICIVAILLLSPIQFKPSHPQYHTAHIVYVICYSLTMWSLVSLTIGVFQKICNQSSKTIRYIADSSYWLYLVHLPIAVWLQVAFAELPGHWTLKLTAISILTIGISLLLYDLFVRSTVIGQILNGRKRDRLLFKAKS